MFRTTAPGGYIEFQDYGCEIFLSGGTKLEGDDPDHPASGWIFHTTQAAERAGRPLLIARGMEERMRKAGFVDVKTQTVVWPMGPWPKQKGLKEIGKWGKIGMMESAYPFALHLLTRDGWSKEKIRDMTNATIASLDKGKYYAQGWFVYGRKEAT